MSAAAARRFKLTQPEPSEYETHCAISDMLAICLQPPAMFSTFPAFGYCKLTPAQASKLSRLHVQAGIPDILLWPGDGKTLGLEIKRAGSGRPASQSVFYKAGNELVRKGIMVRHGAMLGLIL
jgi:hypothetical protein